MMDLTELRSYLTESADVQDPLKALAKEYHNRNLGPDADVTTSYSKFTEPDPLVSTVSIIAKRSSKRYFRNSRHLSLGDLKLLESSLLSRRTTPYQTIDS